MIRQVSQRSCCRWARWWRHHAREAPALRTSWNRRSCRSCRSWRSWSRSRRVPDHVQEIHLICGSRRWPVLVISSRASSVIFVIIATIPASISITPAVIIPVIPVVAPTSTVSVVAIITAPIIIPIIITASVILVLIVSISVSTASVIVVISAAAVPVIAIPVSSITLLFFTSPSGLLELLVSGEGIVRASSIATVARILIFVTITSATTSTITAATTSTTITTATASVATTSVATAAAITTAVYRAHAHELVPVNSGLLAFTPQHLVIAHKLNNYLCLLSDGSTSVLAFF
mmetsp:Transcript_19408/g.34270  ORF Transcript_19408/g.34270 Transcript_19408/m.34270 type:complete len:291 (-) Transcript_19408:469-1341(-)